MKSSKLSAWDKVLIARDSIRPKTLDYIENIFEDFIELHGDRLYKDDKSIIAGIGKIDKYVVTVIGQQKGKTTKENIERNFGMTNPEGYRKALRLMKQAEKFRKTNYNIYRYTWCISRNWSRGKRSRRSNSKKLVRNVKIKSTYNMHCNW